MRQRGSLIMCLILAGTLLAAGATLAQARQAASLVTSEGIAPNQPAGRGYRLASPNAAAETVASGGGYVLLHPESTNASPPPSAEVGCCCTYLPCTLKQH